MAAASISKEGNGGQTQRKHAARARLDRFMEYALPYVSPLKNLDKAQRKAKKEGAGAVQAAAQNTRDYLRKMALAYSDEFRSSLPLQGDIVKEIEKKSDALETALHDRKHEALGIPMRPVVYIGMATLVIWAISSMFAVSLTGLFGTIGIGIMVGVWLAAGIASWTVDIGFSKSEKAPGAWKRALETFREEEGEKLKNYSLNVDRCLSEREKALGDWKQFEMPGKLPYFMSN
ncbi:MAG: hypothetical protein WC717_01420 [Candidatus Micrarchaeia archaeon]|jgi:hypothetical protein